MKKKFEFIGIELDASGLEPEREDRMIRIVRALIDAIRKLEYGRMPPVKKLVDWKGILEVHWFQEPTQEEKDAFDVAWFYNGEPETEHLFSEATE